MEFCAFYSSFPDLPQVNASIGDLGLGDVASDGHLDIVLADWGPENPEYNQEGISLQMHPLSCDVEKPPVHLRQPAEPHQRQRDCHRNEDSAKSREEYANFQSLFL